MFLNETKQERLTSRGSEPKMTPVIIRAKSGKDQRNGEFPNRRTVHNTPILIGAQRVHKILAPLLTPTNFVLGQPNSA